MALNLTLVDLYQSFYDDPANNAYTDYTLVYASYVIPVRNSPPITPVDLASLVYSSSTPHLLAGFLLLGTNGPIICYHQLARFVAQMRLPVTAWDGEGYAIVNYLLYDQSTTVSWDILFFNIVTFLTTT